MPTPCPSAVPLSAPACVRAFRSSRPIIGHWLKEPHLHPHAPCSMHSQLDVAHPARWRRPRRGPYRGRALEGRPVRLPTTPIAVLPGPAPPVVHQLRHQLAVLHQLHLLGQRALQLPAHCPCCGPPPSPPPRTQTTYPPVCTDNSPPAHAHTHTHPGRTRWIRRC
jgi:hypothetical protein